MSDDGPLTRYAVLFEGRLAAQIRRGSGTLRRAGRAATTDARELAYADIEVFDAKRAELIAQLAASAPDLDTLLFRLRLEGGEVREGDVVIAGAGLRRL